jgi:hypothetical protein
VRAVTAAVAALLVLAAPALPRADAKALVGTWAMALDPSTVMVLKADGTGSFGGESIRWQLRGDRLAVTDAGGATDVNGVKVEGNQLLLVGEGGVAVLFQRVEGAPAARTAASPRTAAASSAPRERAPAATKTSRAGTPADQQVRDLLLSSAWCSFSYRSTPGGGGYGSSSSSTRVVFRQDGTGARGSSSETYSTGSGGQYAGARQGGDAFRWDVRGGRLLVDTGAGLEDVNLTATRNSNGYPILNAGGVEYSMCR